MNTTDPRRPSSGTPGLSEEVRRPSSGAEEIMRRAMEAEQRQRQRKPQLRAADFPGADFVYPWTLEGLGGWIPIVVWSGLAGGAWGVTLVWAMQAGLAGVRAMLPGTVILTVIAAGYVCACCMRVIEAAANKLGVQDWPPMAEWKQWADSLLFFIVVGGQVGLAAAAATFWALAYSVWPTVFLALLLLPLGLLAALESDMWTPFSRPVFATLISHAGKWLVFHLQWAGLLAAWAVATFYGLLAADAWFFALSGPLLGTILLIASRLIGRLASEVSEIKT